jgi:hypothetical protein
MEVSGLLHTAADRRPKGPRIYLDVLARRNLLDLASNETVIFQPLDYRC